MVELCDDITGYCVNVGRVIGKLYSGEKGPTIIFTAGIHGNEPSGIFAIDRVFSMIESEKIKFKGSVYGLSGNLSALSLGERYLKSDLNRLWTYERMNSLKSKLNGNYVDDEREQVELFNEIQNILKTESGPFYFFDLHTTSSETNPFLTVNDCLVNRKFANLFPIPMILGIEEYLDGPLLSYINELGYVAFGFEGGSHNDHSSIDNHEAFILLSLVYSGSIRKKSIDYYKYYDRLAKTSHDSHEIFEIFYRFEIDDIGKFRMKPGFVNFQKIRKGTYIAKYNGVKIKAKESGRVFMPLYQNQGEDGFFLIREVNPFFLHLSARIRKMKLDRMLPLLPGVKWFDKEDGVLEVNTKIARFFARKFFHLFGYRAKSISQNKYLMRNREKASRSKDYENERFYQ
ncbi:succinylglutamate desuccinylase/aspartoacylase family protein [Marinigracilibium pacificum]|uniref:Succinylglutamate desuccinylase/aspartoacylase family protein n=1 Tax=Marinigracilibium pacificum TaxID=2729599 RepID=A0A848IVQ9_9BACT|nr:succinylglutamate desuccinylase/aspartoacylase family protein [Marinigracilibium pacificum]NMM48573.1 succinylglutamate desuccinylase/aspartoacylase family protein [Marinigracilibium pacificum]